MSAEVSTKHLRHNDMRPRFDDETYEQVVKEACVLSIPKNTYVQMLVKAALKLPKEERMKLLYSDM